MKFLKRFFLLILLLVLALIGIGYLLPDSAHVERTARINAPPQAVFPHVNDLRQFREWSPWSSKDADAEYTFQGPDEGVGAHMFWESANPDIGSGSMLITQSRPPSRVAYRLEFVDHGNATSYFEIQDANGDSRVTWGFDSEFGNNYIQRYFGLLMDRWIGSEYEQGLRNLKERVESAQAE